MLKRILSCYDFLFDFWMKFPEKVRFLLVGGSNFVTSYVIFLLFLWMLGNPAKQVALILSFIFSSPISFWTQRVFVFSSDDYLKERYVKCLIVWTLGYLLNAMLLEFFVDILGIIPEISQLIASIVVAISNYIFLKHFAFKEK